MPIVNEFIYMCTIRMFRKTISFPTFILIIFLISFNIIYKCSHAYADQQSQLISIKLDRGDTIEKLFKNNNVREEDLNNAIKSIKKVLNPRKLYAGQTVTLITKDSKNGKILNQAIFYLTKNRFAVIQKTINGTYEAIKTRKPEYVSIPFPFHQRPSLLNSPTETKVHSDKSQPRKNNNDNDLIDEGSHKKIGKKNIYHERVNSEQNLVTFRTRPGDTLASIISNTKTDLTDRDEVIKSLREYFNPRHLRVGQEIIILTEIRNNKVRLVGISIKMAESKYLQALTTLKKTFSVKIVKNPLNTEFDNGESEVDLTDNSLINRDNLDSEIIPLQRPRPKEKKHFVLDGALIAASSPIRTNNSSDIAKTAEKENNENETSSQESKLEQTLISVSIKKGDVLATALKRGGISDAILEDVIFAFKKIYNPRKLQIGQKLEITYDNFNSRNDGKDFVELNMNLSPTHKLQIRKDVEGFKSTKVKRPINHALRFSDGIIKSSLYLAAERSGLPKEILLEVVHIFGFAVDWQRDVQRGDHFSVLYEVLLDKKDKPVGYGSVIYASLNLSNSVTSIFRHEFADGSSDYFEETGKSVRKALMKTPINGARLSSGYGMRKHPIQGYNKMHRGLDFAAPIGTPIMAAGDGIIEKIGRYNSYGKYIRIRHNNTYSTAYAHLSGYAKNLRKNSRVKQGQVIGYVGSTGRSTGPHLHYEILSGGKQINPTKVKLPSGRQLKESELVEFNYVVRKIKVLLTETGL